jgi:hypothetical protein
MYRLITPKQQKHGSHSVNAFHPACMSLHYLQYAVIPWNTTCPLDNMVACVECHNAFHHLVLSAGSIFYLRTSILSNMVLIQNMSSSHWSRRLESSLPMEVLASMLRCCSVCWSCYSAAVSKPTKGRAFLLSEAVTSSHPRDHQPRCSLSVRPLAIPGPGGRGKSILYFATQNMEMRFFSTYYLETCYICKHFSWK